MTNPQIPGESQNPNPGPDYDLRVRAFEFALRILDVTARLPDIPEGRVVRGQLARSGTAIGANVEEADGAYSRADTRKSFVISRKEARETRYWLRISDRKWPSPRVAAEIAEATALLRILSTIIARLK